MKIEHSSVELIKEPNILKKIELAGRTCYNSHNLITEDSYKKFISRIMKSGHGSVIEHSNIIIKYYETTDVDDIEFVYTWLLARKGITDSHLWITLEKENDNNFIMMSGNARAWLDFLVKDVNTDHLIDVDDHIRTIYMALHEKYPELFINEMQKPWSQISVEIITEEEAANINIVHTSYTFKIFTSRDITHQLVRHRVLSFSQQSQRYINYTLDKNGGGDIPVIEPRISKESPDYNEWLNIVSNVENAYDGFIDDDIPPEVARCVLTNCTGTVIYITGHYNDWQHFIELRSDSHAQEEIQEISNKIDKEIKKCYI